MAKKQKSGKNKNSQETAKGVIEITRSGLAYVITGDPGGDVLVRPADFNKAFNGDTVRVKITRSGWDGRKREGRVEEVLHRRQTDFIGNLRQHAGRWYFLPDTEKPLPHFELDSDPEVEIDEEQKVIVRFLRWNKEDRRPVCELKEVVTDTNLSDMAMRDILLENGFPLTFTDEALEDAERLPETISAAELKKRKDFREILTFTIDPADARDFDDAISIRSLRKGIWEIGVHIADVSHFVNPGTQLDEEAYERATSVYLPDRVNPMLPERISNELCSLRPHEDKYTFSAVFEVNSKCEVKSLWLGRTVIHSDHRFTYEEVQEIIESGDGKYSEEILLLNKLAQLLRKKRFAKGAINFSSTESRFKLDENGKPIGVVIKESKEAHQLIEEWMLMANKAVAEKVAAIKIKDKPLPFPYRVHDQPNEEKLEPFMAFARKFGYKFNTNSPESIAASFNEMLKLARGTPQQAVLEQLGIRTMAKAVYTIENIGHYGLAFENYCHFTSPIRRYPDVLVHRILQEVLDGKTHADKRLEEKCRHCSERERAAMDSERAANKYKQVEYMTQFLGETFEAVISGVATFGFWAETVEHKCEGLVSLKDLNYYDDYRL
ncbi:MAG: ribonuclease R, partial [Chitinophagaceae bacterium]|nr:ribonuclease R [Chitinophagaceae bacterium]